MVALGAVVLFAYCAAAIVLAHNGVPNYQGWRFRRDTARATLPLAALIAATAGQPRRSTAATSIGSAQFLLTRLESYEATAYRPGITISDIFYPRAFEGRWSASSVLTGFEAPLGEALFGGRGAVARAEGERSTPLVYETVFRGIGDTVVANRLLNVENIARASMGPDSVLDDRQAPGDESNIDRLHIMISPSTAMGLIFDISLLVTDREQFVGPQSQLCALERTVQTIHSNRDRNTSSKAIETITSYQLESSSVIRAKQRTATFWDRADSRYETLLQDEPLLGRVAYDVRQYEVTYTRQA